MDLVRYSIQPRRALHNRAWQFNAFGNSVLPPRQIMATMSPVTVQQLQQAAGTDDILKYPISTINPITYEDQKQKALEPKESKRNICKHIMMKLYAGLMEYFNATTLHGLKYVGDSTLSAFERIYWLAAFCAGFCFAVYFIASIYAKYNTSPMVISFNPKLVFLNEIPFPAITICNVNLALRSKAIEIKEKGPATQKALLGDFCNSQLEGDHEIPSDANTTDWNTVEQFIIDVNQNCDNLVKICKWNGEAVDCNGIINSILTDEGYCCAFNQLPLNMTLRGNFKERGNFPGRIVNWNAEDGYGETEPDTKTYPYRATGQGQGLGLTLVLDAQLDEYFCTSTNSIGFKLLLSAPNERPKIAEVGFLLTPGGETRISILPDVKDATDGVRNIHVDKRQCFFARERSLAYFNLYSEKNCRLECQTNYTMYKCNCVPYYLPKNPDDPICDRAKEKCIQLAKSQIERFTPERSLCRCLPSCHDISYKPDTMSTGLVEGKYDTVNNDILQNMSTKYFSENMAIVHFFFEMDKYVKQTKSEMYGFSEFLSNTGGLLGLFLGFSFLSAIEIIYFLLIRWPCRYYRRFKAQKLKEKQEEQNRWANIPYVQ